MHLNSVIQVFVNQFCPNVQVVSDFFQINPQNQSEINYVTGQRTQTNNLILFQKSDVKRPNVSGNAWKAEWTFEKLMETLTFLQEQLDKMNPSDDELLSMVKSRHLQQPSEEIGRAHV